jgi:orotidine-5'-phosphate decarboxylase
MKHEDRNINSVSGNVNENFADKLQARIDKLGNPTVMGLDPLIEYIPEQITSYINENCDDPTMAAGLAIYEFNRRLIDATCEIVPAVKPQLAYYEKYGVHGWEALRQTIEYAKRKGMLVIADGKRNDIGSTAGAYADAILGRTTLPDGSIKAMLGADCITANAWLGIDGIEPFLKICRENGKGIFILVRTSNPSATDIQDLRLEDGRKVYEAMADKVSEWGLDLFGKCGYSSAGAVVGATWPEQAAELRRRMPQAFILVPGYGAQGAGADDAVAGFGEDGKGGIVNASRSLMCAYKKQELPHEAFDIACRQEAVQMRENLRKALAARG